MTRLTYTSFVPSGAPAASLARAGDDVAVDLAPFVRVAWGAQALGGQRASVSLEPWARGQLGHGGDPRSVSLAALRTMDHHPMVHLAERTIGGIVRRPDLYFVRHPDRRIVRETEAWLWPLLPKLLGVAARAFSYGSVPVVLDWGVDDLAIEVPKDDGGARRKTLVDHVHYTAAHEVWPGDAQLLVDDADRLVAIEYGGVKYLADRAHVFRWDPAFDSWLGQSARRRAWRDYLRSLSTEGLHARYLEHSVDSPRIAYAPAGTTNAGGEEVPLTDHMGHLLVALRGAGAISLPSLRDVHGQRKYEIETLDLPDRKDVWQQALTRYDGGILKAFLVPPTLTGMEDLAAAGAKHLDGMLKEFVQDLAIFAADNLTTLARAVHARNHDPKKVPPPDVLAFEVPAAARKLYLEVLRVVSAANVGQSAAEWVDVPALLDQLGVPLRTAPASASPERQDAGDAQDTGGQGGGGGGRGRPRDMTGERQERREDARTDEGEESVGKRTEGEA